MRRHDDHWELRVELAEVAAKLHAIDPRHLQVSDHEVWSRATSLEQRLLSSRRRRNHESRVEQQLLEQAAAGVVIVDDEDARGLRGRTVYVALLAQSATNSPRTAIRSNSA
jgi:hypothetical protein